MNTLRETPAETILRRAEEGRAALAALCPPGATIATVRRGAQLHLWLVSDGCLVPVTGHVAAALGLRSRRCHSVPIHLRTGETAAAILSRLVDATGLRLNAQHL